MEFTFITILILIGIQVAVFGALTLITNKLIHYRYLDKFRWIAFAITLIISGLTGLGFRELIIPLEVIGFIVLINTALTIFIEIAFIDFKYFEIPDSYNLFLVIIGVASMSLLHFKIRSIYDVSSNYILPIIMIGVLMFVLYFILAIFSGGSLGMGDVKMSLGIGLIGSSSISIYIMSNYPQLEGMLTIFRILFKEVILNHALYSFLFGAIVSIVLLVTKVKSKKDKIAFGPYLALGVLTLLWLGKYSFFQL